MTDPHPHFTLFAGDCVRTMREHFAANSIDLVVTSPPYDNLRAYNGFTFDFTAVAAELTRVIKPGGVIVWVVGDASIDGSETGTSFRQSLHFIDTCGLRLHDTMLYGKANPCPQNKRRYEQAFEYSFVFSKGAPATFNGLREPSKDAGKLSRGSQRARDGNTVRSKTRTPTVVHATKLRSNVWFYPNSGRGINHPAVFPERLAADHILSWSQPGELVFDPFTGSGTTGKAALSAGRRFVGCEISDAYLAVARERIACGASCLTPAASIGSTP